MISEKKVVLEKERIVARCASCRGQGCAKCFGYCSYIDRLVDAEIPVDYWYREMKEFYGDQFFKNSVLEYISSLKQKYLEGASLCFTGHPGTGKTMAACSILKAAVLPHRGSPEHFSAYYTTMLEATSKMMSNDSHYFRNQLKNIDFVVLDEVDPRFFPSEGSRGLHGNHFENIFRVRTQNRLPTIICTNSEDINQIFSGEFKRTFESLQSQFVKVLRAGGKDVRKGKEKL